MKPLLTIITTALALTVLTLGVALDASAAEVRAGISTRETYVGLPVTLQIQVANASTSDPPTIPDVDGLTIKSLGTPSRSTQTTFINGNVSSSSTVTYSYEVTPQRPGSFRIPPITVQADGRDEQTQAFDFVASKSETGDLLFVEIAGKEKQIYVGQSLDLTLRIWLRPYRDKDHNITLSEENMWQLLAQRTAFGPFAERVQQMAENNQRPAGKEVLRKDRDGVEHSYYLYEIDATIYPKKPGHIDASGVQVVVQYPTALGQLRDPFASFFDDMPFPGGRGGPFGDDSGFSPFGSRLTVESVRPIVAEAKVEPIDVLEIPTAGRPADYRGAVGRYHIITEASPSSVKAGDPINLLVGVAGTGPMELVQAPPLAELPELTADFKVPNEPLAGFVQNDRKVFSTTVRPRKAGVSEIPAIPFSYFDPAAKKFVTVHSKPITIHVAPADTLALADVVGRSKAATTTSEITHAAASADASPRLAIFTGDNLLANESPPAMISRPLIVLLAFPPLAVLGLLILRSRRGLSALAGRFGSSLEKCQARINEAEQPTEIAAALREMLTKRLGLGRAWADATTIVGALRSAGYRQLAVRCERILDGCETHGQVGVSGLTLSELKRDALELVADLQTESRRPRPTTSYKRRAVTTSLIAIVAASLLLSTGSARAAAEHTPADTLTSAQQQSLLAEANEHYTLALNTAATDSAEAKQAFADAAEKYQLLVDAGVHNSRLYVNLASAYLESGDTARAIVNYRRSLRLDPTNQNARTNLAYAENLLSTPAANDSGHVAGSISDYAAIANDTLNRFFSPRIVLATAILAWLAFWAAIGARLLAVRFPWKSLATAALILTAVATTSYSLSCQSLSKPTAIIISPAATLRTGDGENFPSLTGVALHPGQQVDYFKHRGDWLQVRTDSGQCGWLPDSAAEIL